MPVTIGVFVTPGRVLAANAETANDRFNRSFEYDGLGDAYARFILEEILPEVEKQKTSDGRAIHLSKMGMTGPLADQAAELFAHLLPHGNGLKNSPVCLALSAHMSGFAEPTVIQHLLENMSPNPSGSFYRMAPMILIFMAAIGGKPMKQWSGHSHFPVMRCSMFGERAVITATRVHPFFPLPCAGFGKTGPNL